MQIVAAKIIRVVHAGDRSTAASAFRFDPRSVREAVAAVEVASVAEINEVRGIAVERFAEFSVAPFGGTVEFALAVFVCEVRDIAAFAFIQGHVNHHVGGNDGLLVGIGRSGCQPFLKVCVRRL